MHRCPATEILYGGAKYGGKSVAILNDLFEWCCRVKGLQVYLFRRTYPELWDNHIRKALVEFPKEVCEWHQKESVFAFKNGSLFHMAYCNHEKDVLKHQGRAIHVLGIDEVTLWSKFMYDILYSNVRLDIDVPEEYRHLLPRIVVSGNPGGIGHAWVKSRWIAPAEPLQIWKEKPDDPTTRCFIPAKIYDNPRGRQTDPSYELRLDRLPPPLQKALKEGDWDVFAGQVFNNLTPEIHQIQEIRIPDTWYLFRAMDWGHAQPFSYGLYAMDFNGRMYRIREWYGWNGNANEGLKMDPEEVASGIQEIEKEFEGRVRPGPGCPIMFNKTGGRSIAERMASKGIVFVHGDIDPVNRLIETYTRLNQNLHNGTPMLLTIKGHDKHFWRLMPEMIADDQRPEIVDKDQEDHLYEEVSLACMYRALKPPKREEVEQRRRDDEYPMLDPETGI